MTTTASMRIGAVVDALKAEFPDVSVSKVRFLEGEGLIHPTRTASGYRQFTNADVEQVRYILRQQRDHFLPLKVIKEKLVGLERGVEPTTEQLRQRGGVTWSHPAFAHRHIFARNDKELVCASLEAD